MKSLIGFAILVAALVVAGAAFRRASLIEDRLATAREQLTTTSRVAPELAAQLDESVSLVGRIPVIGTRITREVRRQRAEGAYWQGDYVALAPAAVGTTEATEDDPLVLLLSANARFRNAVRQNRTPQTLIRSLDEVLKGYGEVLKADPASTDAAFNYEYVVRLRAALAGGRGSNMPAPETSNMQGEEGEPPTGNQQSDFNVIVPLRPEERQEQMDPGAGAEFKRKG
jgi:hypothetical protein